MIKKIFKIRQKTIFVERGGGELRILRTGLQFFYSFPDVIGILCTVRLRLVDAYRNGIRCMILKYHKEAGGF